MAQAIRVPKRIGGVKIPKPLRKRAKRLLELADTPLVSATIAAALIAGAAAVAEGKSRRAVLKAAGIGAGAAAVKAAKGADRIALALAIAGAGGAAGLSGLLGNTKGERRGN